MTFKLDRETEFSALEKLEPIQSNEQQASSGSDAIFESAKNSSSGFGDSQIRAMAIGAALTWVEEGKFEYTELDHLVIGVTDLDGDSDITEDEKELYADVWDEVVNALISLGGAPENVKDFVDNEDDDAGERLGKRLKGILDDEPAPDSEIVAAFVDATDAILESGKATDDVGSSYEFIGRGEDGKDMILEAAFKKVKVIRDGKVQVKRKRISGKARLSAAQKAALKKARRKANSSAAKRKRKKSMKQRKSRGM